MFRHALRIFGLILVVSILVGGCKKKQVALLTTQATTQPHRMYSKTEMIEESRKCAQDRLVGYARSGGEELAKKRIEYESKFYWMNACGTFNIPVLYSWSAVGASGDEVQPPQEVLDQIRGKVAEPGMRVMYQGKPCVIVMLSVSDGEKIPKDFEPDDLAIADGDYFDFDHW